jgi:hypothetical protein
MANKLSYIVCPFLKKYVPQVITIIFFIKVFDPSTVKVMGLTACPTYMYLSLARS